MRTKLRRSWLPILLFGFALALRCYGLGSPLLDYHSWRQADTAAMARNFISSGYQFQAPQVDWGGQTPGYVESEFPLYSGSLALLWGWFGPHVWIGRLLSALASAAACAALYSLVRSSSGRRAALYAGLTLALLPFALYFGRAVMPDAWMLLGAVLALLTFQRWLDQPSAGRFRLALLFGALAPLTKTPNLIIVGVPLLYLAWPLLAVRPARMPLLIYAACFALPALLWTAHARTLPLDPRLSFGIGEKLFDLRLLLDPQFYLLLARWSVEDVLTWVGLPLFLLGLFTRHGDTGTRRQGDKQPNRSPFLPVSPSPLLAYAWLLGVLLFLLAGAAGVVGQDYYILPLAGPAAWFIGMGLDQTCSWIEQRTKRREQHLTDTVRHIRLLFVALFFVLLTGLSVMRIAPLYRTADFYQTLGQRVDMALPAGARVGVIAPAVSEILFYGNRKGWRLDPGVLVPGGLSSLGPDLGVRYVLVADPWLTERRDVLTEALQAYRRVPVGPYAWLLDLQQPGYTVPFEIAWETGHVVQEPFLSAWRMRGGTAGFGLPLSDAIAGPEGQEQYFERGLLRLENGHVERAEVGRLLLKELGRAPQPAEVAAPFQEAWQRIGGEATLGTALSPVVAMPDGTQIQFFFYGTLEQPPGGVPTLGASGRRLLEARGLTEERQIVMNAQDARRTR